MTILLREAIGDRLRHARTTQRRTLREISRTARVSLGYLSEVERGQKEASSELLAAICGALELPLQDLLQHVATDIGAMERVAGIDQTAKFDAERSVTGTTGDRSESSAEGKSVHGGSTASAGPGTQLADLQLSPSLTQRLPNALPTVGVTVAA